MFDFFMRVTLSDATYCEGCPGLKEYGDVPTCAPGEFSMRTERIGDTPDGIGIWRTLRPKGCPLFPFGPQLKRK